MIPAGYQLHITTWENDADAFQTKIISGLSDREVRFLLSIARRFRSRNGRLHEDPDGLSKLGNGGVSGEKLAQIFKITQKEYSDVSQHFKDEWFVDLENNEYIEDHAYETLTNLINYPVDEYYRDVGNFCRVFDSYKVYHYETPVEDVSDQFSK